ncbi:hypothetical protein EOA27_10240 [Mesorhizobium sp. M2A.F.Ca.ET.037.01.1.1]|uniref:hypothetical protein n=2 Tax=Mesorhizobium TaxID=68287 RepID=UPI000F75F848|nr:MULTISPECIES: hypothetical protein [unclassified Mesorhizobium]RUY11622.1 hypothetical protein EOA25_05540 [Mesorhizobium sp. M2A.F.Ca.ET.040.01.1.1]RVC79821.1 hypothetical protein EN766_06555 [Mesorhizobium sp. M2A.F.Ca.ET.046.02.1.1]AZO34331.1 hypothetical protein EJ072_07625 [Mesorhizobium sp. M2A.F.Ca.ET.046.03.2.1]RUX19831.1 hypothetical protein EOA27_10240 [Mesorhizobium sp. M2A.F.Ca.ET.037.01.1.1]RWA90045.1 MAG: hypothetical protein EOQ31_15335 [Mesorhizobium sp.]
MNFPAHWPKTSFVIATWQIEAGRRERFSKNVASACLDGTEDFSRSLAADNAMEKSNMEYAAENLCPEIAERERCAAMAEAQAREFERIKMYPVARAMRALACRIKESSLTQEFDTRTALAISPRFEGHML